MTQSNSLNVKLPNSQLNKLESAIKNETEVVFDYFWLFETKFEIMKYGW